MIELGFEKPKNVTEISWIEDEKDNPIINANTIEYTRHYSIGELLSFLPRKIYRDYNYYELSIFSISRGWYVLYAYFGDGFMWTIKRETHSTELIDAIFEMIVELKEEGVI